MKAVFLREWLLTKRSGGGGLLTAVLFVLLASATIAFGVGANLPVLARVGPGVLWAAVLLASLLGLETILRADSEDGTLDLVRTAGTSLLGYATAKIFARTLLFVAPLAFASPLAAVLLAMPGRTVVGGVATLLLAAPALAVGGTLGAAATFGLRGTGLLGPVLVLPLFVPLVIFGAAAARDWSEPAGTTPLLLLAATSLVYTALGPLACAALLRR